MSRIELTRKTIDPLTGSDVIEKRVFKLPANADPTMSVVFHKTADLLGIKTFDRTNPHVYRKLAVLYNWAADKAKSNDPDKVFDKLEGYRAKLGLNVLGNELVDTLYRDIRLELDRNAGKAEMRLQEEAGVAGELQNTDAGELSAQAWEDSASKDRNIKVRVTH